MALKLVVAPGRILHRSLQQNPNQRSLSLSSAFSYPLAPKATSPSNLCLTTSRIHHNRFVTYCINRAQEFVEDVPETPTENEYEVHKDFKQEEKRLAKVEKKELANQGLWNQMKEIIMFTGPATGLWICGPLMSLIDTAVIGQGSSVELAALGPATVVCDYMSYTFMFLSVATSNMLQLPLLDGTEKKCSITWVSLWLHDAFVHKIFGEATLTAFIGQRTCSTCSKHLCPDSRLGMACSSCWLGCSECKSWYERFMGTLEGFGCS